LHHVQFNNNVGSSDGTIQIIDLRVGDLKRSQLSIKAHESDVNVIDWNAKAAHLLASGSDDSTVKVWDLRHLKQQQKGLSDELICFSWHEEPITSIAFQPNE
jgi:ribosome assembly protein RRB1